MARRLGLVALGLAEPELFDHPVARVGQVADLIAADDVEPTETAPRPPPSARS
jgi:hypothetical protein